MMLKNILIVVFLLVVFNAAFVFFGGLDLLVKTEEHQQIKKERVTNLDPDLVDLFRATLESEVEKNANTKIDSFEPQMFLDVFPGLAETDFANVRSRIGFYNIKDGRVVHDLGNPTVPIHDDAKAMNRDGYQTLLENVSKRTNINLKDGGTITDIMNVLTAN